MNSQLKKVWDWFTLSPAKKAQLDWEEIKKNATLHRCTPSGERRIFRVPVGDKLNATDILEAFQAQKAKEPLMDPITGDFNWKYNMTDAEADYFVPVRANAEIHISMLHPPVDYQPKMNNQYLVVFPEWMNIKPVQVVAADKPVIRNYHGEDILGGQTFLINDVLNANTAACLGEWVAAGNRRRQPEVLIYDLDPTGVWNDKWTMKNCDLIELDFGHMSFKSKDDEELQTIRLVLKPTSFTVERRKFY